ncbi:MAG: hypothetical protein LW832_09170 [Parachlamydia sp.]|jgi:hypothetical protein|nr:hypothetical protein [Parachlamydia sp.]
MVLISGNGINAEFSNPDDAKIFNIYVKKIKEYQKEELILKERLNKIINKNN